MAKQYICDTCGEDWGDDNKYCDICGIGSRMKSSHNTYLNKKEKRNKKEKIKELAYVD